MSRFSEINKDIKRGIIITFFSKYSVVLFQIVIGMILARLISPEEYGIVAVVMVFTSFYSIIGQMGLGPAVIQKTLDSKEVSTVFYLSIFVGLLLGVINFFLSFVIAAIYNNNIYATLLQLLSLAVFFRVITMTPSALLRKNKRFITVGICRLISEIISSVIAIIAALHGLSYYSLIIKAIVAAVTLFILEFILSRLKLYATFIKAAIRKVFSYSFFQFLSNTFNYFSRNIDTLIIGKVLGETPLGNYDKAFRLTRYPINNFTNLITPVLHPILANHQNDVELIYKVYNNLIKKLAYIGIVISIAAFFASEEIIIIMYGDKWVNAIDIFRIFSLSIVFNMLLTTNTPIFQSLNKTGFLFLSNITYAFLVITAVIIGVSSGIQTVTAFIVCAITAVFFINFFLLIHIVMKKSFSRFLLSLRGPFFAGCILAALLFAVDLLKIDNIYVFGGIKITISGIYITVIYYKFVKSSKKNPANIYPESRK